VTTTDAHRSRVGARVLSEVLTPAAVNIFVAVAIGLHSRSSTWGVVVALAAGGLPLIAILLSVRAGKLGDHHVTNRAERPLVIALIFAALVICLIAQLLLAAPRPVIGLTATMIVTLIVLGAVTGFAKVKISVHTAVAAGATVMLSIAISPVWALAAVVVALLMWARVRIEEHTPIEVVAGAGVGLVVAAVVFGMIH